MVGSWSDKLGIELSFSQLSKSAFSQSWVVDELVEASSSISLIILSCQNVAIDLNCNVIQVKRVPVDIGRTDRIQRSMVDRRSDSKVIFRRCFRRRTSVRHFPLTSAPP